MIDLNIHCQWHPLRSVMVGRVYDREFFREMPASKTKHMLEQIADETEQDFQDLCDLLSKHDVSIIRPDRAEGSIQQFIQDETLIPRPPMAPRDGQLVIGDKMFLVGADHPNIISKLEDVCYAPFLKMPGYSKRPYNDLTAPSITQLGQDIIVDRYAKFHHIELAWLQKQLPHNRINQIALGGHNDGDFIFLKPGVGIARRDIGIDWATLMPDWDMLEIDSDEDHPYRKMTNARSPDFTKWWMIRGETDQEFEQFVAAWLTDWIGNVQETIFSINALIIDESKVVFAQHDNRVFDFLDKHSIEPIVCPYRHQYFWDNGIHCSTLDLNRSGDTFNLFTQREAAIIM